MKSANNTTKAASLLIHAVLGWICSEPHKNRLTGC